VTSGAASISSAAAGANAIKSARARAPFARPHRGGVGIPQLTRSTFPRRAPPRRGVRLIADGGIRSRGDIVKPSRSPTRHPGRPARLFPRRRRARSWKSPASSTKQYRGMGSHAAMKAALPPARPRQNDTARNGRGRGPRGPQGSLRSVDDVLGNLIGASRAAWPISRPPPRSRRIAQEGPLRPVTPAGQKEAAPRRHQGRHPHWRLSQNPEFKHRGYGGIGHSPTL